MSYTDIFRIIPQIGGIYGIFGVSGSVQDMSLYALARRQARRPTHHSRVSRPAYSRPTILWLVARTGRITEHAHQIAL